MSLKFKKYISSEAVDVNTESEKEYFHPSAAISKKSINKYKQIFDGLYIITDSNTGSNQVEMLPRADTFLVDQLPADPIISSQDKLYVYIILSEPEAYVYIQLPGSVRNKWEKLSDVKYIENQGITDGLLYDSGYYFLVTPNPAVSVPATSDIINIGLESSIARYEQLSETNMLAALYNGELLCIAPDDLKEVTSVSSYSFNSVRNLHTIEFPDGVTHISNNAIYGCPNLSKITIPKSVISLSNSFCGNSNLSEIKFKGSVEEWCQFEGPIFAGNGQECPKLYVQDSFIEYLTIPETATKIGKFLFKDYTHLKEVHIPASVNNMGEKCFQSCSKLVRASINVKSIPMNAFNACYELTDLTFGDAVEKIGKYAFCDCSKLKTVSLPEGLKAISDDAFYSCSSLERITLPSTLTYTASNAFDNCSRLSDIYINDLGAYCTAGFYSYCDHMNLYLDDELITELIIPNNTTHISPGAFRFNKNLISVTIPDTITSIGFDAFQGCSSLTSITIPNSVTSIGNDAFSNCSNLVSVHAADIVKWCRISFSDSESNPLSYAHTLHIDGEPVTKLTIPDSLTCIGSYTFYDCTSLTSVTIPDTITSIGKYALSGCTGLTSIVIPDSVTSISSYAFSGCTGLASVTIPDNVTSISSYAFSGCSSLTIYCEAASKPSGWDSDWNPSNRPVVWGYNNVTSNIDYDYVVHNGKASLTKYKGTDTEIIIPSTIDGYVVTRFGEIFKNNTSITSVVIPNSVTSIGDYAFYNCTSLTSVTIPDNVTSIGSYAFEYCTSLTSITIPDSVTSIGSSTFAGCTGLKSILIPDSVTSIGNNAFRECTNLSSVVIGNSVTSIGSYAFGDCKKLTSLVIPDSVTSIDYAAFYNCTSIALYYEALRKPIGWNPSWSCAHSYFTPRWGYTGETYEYTLVRNDGTDGVIIITASTAFTLTTPTREGWYFGGWYDNIELSGKPVSSPYSSKTVHTLYAKWLTEEEYSALRDGTSFEKAYIITAGEIFDADIKTTGSSVYFVFTATESKIYTFEANSGYDTHGYLYDSNQSELSYDDDSADEENFRITEFICAGETVYVRVGMPYSTIGMFTLIVS